ncbi:MAG: hypothetical protein EZS28_022853, partial [Streblomastix strix]
MVRLYTSTHYNILNTMERNLYMMIMMGDFLQMDIVFMKRVSLPPKNGEVEFKNVEKFVSKYTKNNIPQHHSGRKVGRRPYKDIHLEVLKFQNDLGACKVFIKALNVGAKFAGVRLVVSSVLGLTPGCDIDAPRIYLLGIYLNIHVHALGIELPP